MKKILTVLAACLCSFSVLHAQKKAIRLNRVEPVSWWVGMNNPHLQLLCYGPQLSQAELEVDYPGVHLDSLVHTDNPNYLFAYLTLAPETQPGTMKLKFTSGKKVVGKYDYVLNARRDSSAQRESFGCADAVYLLMPDRFVNGNPKNDQVVGYKQGVNRNEPGARHGGDLAGVISKLPYIADLGCTALWITPFFDNNDDAYSYHHYATSDYYKVDPRLGSNEDYKRLSDSCHVHGLKLILDVVPNHCGSAHWWMQDLPAKDWIHTWPQYTSSNYRMTAWTDPHASNTDKEVLEKGWFSHNMPDLNLENPILFTYLSQTYIWWIEYGNVDGLRVDTYPYNNIHLASAFIKTFRQEYPKINIVGECWVKSPLEIAYYQSGNNNKDGFDSNLPSVMDFVLKDMLHAAFNEHDDWDSGMARFYTHYAQDFAYPDPNNIMNFVDNHDIDRFSGAVNRNTQRYKMGIAMLLCTRGYPQIYSGDEIMIQGLPGNYEGYRFDFPGGWSEDHRNAFTPEGRTDQENEVFNYMRSLLHYRQSSTALQSGAMKQFIPYDGIYVMARYNENQTVLLIFNNQEQEQFWNPARYQEVIGNAVEGREVTTGQTLNLQEGFALPAKSVFVIELL